MQVSVESCPNNTSLAYEAVCMHPLNVLDSPLIY